MSDLENQDQDLPEQDPKEEGEGVSATPPDSTSESKEEAANAAEKTDGIGKTASELLHSVSDMKDKFHAMEEALADQVEEMVRRPLFHRIVNYIVGTAAVLFFLFLVALGLTQTQTFRNILKHEVLKAANGYLQGKLSIDNINGTLFTNLSLNGVTLQGVQGDTIASLGFVRVRVKPFYLLLNTIYVQSIDILNLHAKLVKDSSGIYNIAKVFPPTEEDTSAATFDYKVHLESLTLAGVDAVLCDEDRLNDHSIQSEFSLHNLRMENVRAALSADLVIGEKDFTLLLSGLSGKTNIAGFNLEQLSGRFRLNTHFAEIHEMQLKTTRSDLQFDGSIDAINFFAGSLLEQINTAQMRAELTAKPFHFDDLSAFIGATKILKGPVNGDIAAEGSLQNLMVRRLDLTYANSKLSTTGALKNILDGSKMNISAVFNPSSIVLADVEKLLPALSLPRFNGFEKAAFDSLTFSGTPLNFDTRARCIIGGCPIIASAKLNFLPDEAEYTVYAETHNLDLNGIINYPAVFSGNVKIDGSSFNLKRMNTSFAIVGDNSIVGNQMYQKIELSGALKDMTFSSQLKLKTANDSLTAALSGELLSDSIPAYSVSLSSYNLNLAEPLNDSSLATSLNCSLWLQGRGLDFNNISGEASLRMRNSMILGKSFEASNVQVKLNSKINNYKELNINSDFVDVNLHGVFSIGDFGTLIKTELDSVKRTISEKIESYLPALAKKITASSPPQALAELKTTDQRTSKIDASFALKFKDISKLTSFLENSEIALEGRLRGNLKFERSIFSLECNADLPFLKYSDNERAYFANDVKVNIALGHPEALYSFRDLELSADISGSRIHINQDIQDVSCGLLMQHGLLSFKASGGINDKIKASIEAGLDAQKDTIRLTVNKLNFKYQVFELFNRHPALFTYGGGNLTISDFELWRNDSRIALNGILGEQGEQNLTLELSNFRGYDLAYNFLNLPAIDVIDYDLFLNANVTGKLSSPRIDLTLRADSLYYQKKNIGSFVSTTQYANKILSTETKFLEGRGLTARTKMLLSGKIPIDLSFGESRERLISDKNLDVIFRADGFQLDAFSDLVPGITNLHGVLNAEVSLNGTYNNPQQRGYLRLHDGGCKLNMNSIDYGASLFITLDGNKLKLDTISVFNAGKVKNRGRMTGAGFFTFLPDNQIDSRIHLNGDLTVLTNESKNTGSAVYGDLFLKTDGDILFTSAGGKNALHAALIVNEGNLVFSPKQTGFRTASDNFFYRYPPMETKLSARETEIKKLLADEDRRRSSEKEQKKSTMNFDYDVEIKMQSDANFVFILSPETNQKLNASLKGDLVFKQKDGLLNTQGELKVLEGSTLEFIKMFTAAGTLRFESDVTNPNLDITGVYKAYYTESDSGTATNFKEDEVAVKLKIKGPLNDLTKSFTKNEDNLAVYYGKNAIEKDAPSTEYDKADAIWFILLGKFKKDLTQQDRSKASGQIDPLTGTATSLASTFLGSVLNTYLGEAVRSIEFRNLGTNMKFNLSGKFKKFRYTIGGSTNFIQDLSSANVRVEYPLFDNFLIRIERKESVTQSNYQNEMINELGLRYRFQF